VRGMRTVCQGLIVRRATRRREGGLSSRGRRLSAFTLLELVVVVAILGLLMSIMLASLAKVRSAGKSFVCKNQFRSIAFDFIQFSDDWAHPFRGDSDLPGMRGFSIEDFQERQYGVSEFWKGGAVAMSSVGEVVKYKAKDQQMICPAGPQDLEKMSGKSLAQRAVQPMTNISTGLNMRLYVASVPENPTTWTPVRLSKRIMTQITVPLIFDLDGEQAMAMNPANLPYYSAPSIGPGSGLYSLNAFWYPSLRHSGRCNAGFIDGHVSSSINPLNEAGWNWRYQPPVN
jgi:prepilin-type processing-associated H-X9-DG protein/prepilin-type N-terminal cleavage/methylation domain-containing protein